MDSRNPVAGVQVSQRRSLGDASSGPMTMAARSAYRRSSLVFGAIPTAVPCARLHARQVLWEWAAPVDIAAAELLVSELVTNGVQAAGPTGGKPPVGLRLSAANGLVLIEVWDGNRKPARASRTRDGIPPLDQEGGRGLFLVETLSERWGWYPTKDPPGKVTWCELSAPHSYEDLP
jgi:anti-sigma regulatory factor (Ser/Thr protein kinase)